MSGTPLTPYKLVTIIGEALLEDRLVRDLKQAGVTGYTRTEVRGEGHRQVRDEWEGNNVKIETLVTAETANRIFDRLRETYLPFYPMVAWVVDVQAVFAERHVERP